MASSSSSSKPMAMAMAMALALCVALALAAGSVPSAAAGITCGTVTSKLSGCLGYLTGNAASAPAACCAGVKSLYAATKASRLERIAACKCIVTTSKSISGLQAARVAGLPAACGVNLGYKPSPTANCNLIP